MADGEIELMRPRGLAGRLLDDVREWCRGRWWSVRIPLVLYFTYVGVRQFSDTHYTSLFGGLNLGLHEMGHLLFRSGGHFLHIAGGTILQLLAPAALMLMFFRQRDYFAIAVCLAWLSTNFANIGTYMADAEKMALPLVTVGDAAFVIHDWRFLLAKFGLLERCEALGALTRGLGHLFMLAFVAAALWILWQMYRLPPPVKRAYRV